MKSDSFQIDWKELKDRKKKKGGRRPVKSLLSSWCLAKEENFLSSTSQSFSCEHAPYNTKPTLPGERGTGDPGDVSDQAQWVKFTQDCRSITGELTGKGEFRAGFGDRRGAGMSKRQGWDQGSSPYFLFLLSVVNQRLHFNCVTIGLTKTYDAASCDVNYRWICEKRATWL